MLTAISVDDQRSFHKMLDEMIRTDFSDRITIVANASNVKEALQAIQIYRPALVFLDVELQNETGFDLLEQLPERNFEIIFTTAHDHYAIRAIKFSAMDYLLKPFGPDDLKDALDR